MNNSQDMSAKKRRMLDTLKQLTVDSEHIGKVFRRESTYVLVRIQGFPCMLHRSNVKGTLPTIDQKINVKVKTRTLTKANLTQISLVEI